MSTLLLIDGQQTGPYTATQLREMWEAGRITSETLFWREGMTDWLPSSRIIHELEAPTAPPPPTVHQINPSKKKSGCFGLSLKLFLGFLGFCVVVSVLVPRAPSGGSKASTSAPAAAEKAAVPVKAVKEGEERESDSLDGETAGEQIARELLQSGGHRPKPAGVKFYMDDRIRSAKPKNEAAWRKGFERGMAKVWDAKWAEDRKKIEADAGQAPDSADARALVKIHLSKILNDPDSVKYGDWSDVQYVEYKDGKYAWCITTEYRAKNAFGGTVPGKSTGYFRNKQLIALD